MNGTPLYPYFPRTKSGPNLFASDPKPEQERPAHVNLWPPAVGKRKLEEAPFTFPGKPLSAKCVARFCHRTLLSSCSPGTTHDYAIGRAGPSILSSVAPHAPLRKELWLAINKIIHDDDIPVGCSQDAIARRNSDEKNASCVKPDSQERKASAIGRSGQYVLAKQ
jgi:hypothetical protein